MILICIFEVIEIGNFWCDVLIKLIGFNKGFFDLRSIIRNFGICK